MTFGHRKNASRNLMTAPTEDGLEGSSRCLTVVLPDSDEWEMQFFTILDLATTWLNYKPSGTTRETEVAHRWREIIKSIQPCVNPEEDKSMIGAIIPFFSTPLDTSKLLPCLGGVYAKADYPDLWSIIEGADYSGSPHPFDYSTNSFTCPNLSGYVLMGAGAFKGFPFSYPSTILTYNEMGWGGEISHALTSGENGPHFHTIKDVQAPAILSFGSGYSSLIHLTGYNAEQTNVSGSGTPHENRQPFFTVQWWVVALPGYNAATVTGPPGAMGEQGATGNTGAVGEQGIQGVPGFNGDGGNDCGDCASQYNETTINLTDVAEDAEDNLVAQCTIGAGLSSYLVREFHQTLDQYALWAAAAEKYVDLADKYLGFGLAGSAAFLLAKEYVISLADSDVADLKFFTNEDFVEELICEVKCWMFERVGDSPDWNVTDTAWLLDNRLAPWLALKPPGLPNFTLWGQIFSAYVALIPPQALHNRIPLFGIPDLRCMLCDDCTPPDPGCGSNEGEFVWDYNAHPPTSLSFFDLYDDIGEFTATNSPYKYRRFPSWSWHIPSGYCVVECEILWYQTNGGRTLSMTIDVDGGQAVTKDQSTTSTSLPKASTFTFPAPVGGSYINFSITGQQCRIRQVKMKVKY